MQFSFVFLFQCPRFCVVSQNWLYHWHTNHNLGFFTDVFGLPQFLKIPSHAAARPTFLSTSLSHNWLLDIVPPKYTKSSTWFKISSFTLMTILHWWASLPIHCTSVLVQLIFKLNRLLVSSTLWSSCWSWLHFQISSWYHLRNIGSIFVFLKSWPPARNLQVLKP